MPSLSPLSLRARLLLRLAGSGLLMVVRPGYDRAMAGAVLSLA